MTDSQEYPLAIYKGGEVGDDFRIVDDAEAKPRRGRPPKVDAGE